MSTNGNADPQAILLRTDRVSRVYPDGAVTALVDVSLEIRRGEYVAIMGPSGSGKSTLLNLLGALDSPTGGEVFFDGQSLARNADLDRFRSEKLGFVFQSFNLLPTLTASENVQIPMFEGPLPAAQRARKALSLLESVGLAHRASHLPNQLSVGERQRVAIARSLANDPQLLLADEPTGNLDSHSGDEVLALFDRLHRERGMTLVMITHAREVADRAERIVWIRDGRISATDDAAMHAGSTPPGGTTRLS
ncbi:MAG TPA: ABC transporter ATP-binding protein [Pirellulales bacterium]|jgi:putative ABC transport system ATP-binding protein|nr:ABC transporter ATP-binding protein [Pirellulales bacterium]